MECKWKAELWVDVNVVQGILISLLWYNNGLSICQRRMQVATCRLVSTHSPLKFPVRRCGEEGKGGGGELKGGSGTKSKVSVRIWISSL